MFANLDNFLSGGIPDKHLDDDSIDLGAVGANDSLDLDLAIPKAKDIKKPDATKGKNTAFVPAKGQKTAAKRLQKIGETFNRDLKEQDILKTLAEKRNKSKAKASNTRKRASPQKRREARSAASRRRYVEENDDDDDDPDSSDSGNEYTGPAHQREVHDPNTIVLDCDDVFIGGPAVNVQRNLATASAVSAEDAIEWTVSIRINGKIEKYTINPLLKLSVLIGKISEEKSVPPDNITLMLKSKTLSEHESLRSIDYVQGLILYAHISDESTSKAKTSSNHKANANANQLEIKIQAEGRKRPFITHIGPDDPLATLAYACAAEFKCDVSKVALEFDGEFINFKDTPEVLGLEGGEIMDFFKKS